MTTYEPKKARHTLRGGGGESWDITPSTPSPSSIITVTTMTNVSFYVLSGCCQPLLMTLLKDSGVADPSCQLYMLFYYLGPASIILSYILIHNKNGNDDEEEEWWPSKNAILKATGIAIFDIGAASMNYTGAGQTGPTIFAIIYSSVTIWAAIFSQFFLQRKMNFKQWITVFIVFLGLCLTTSHSLHLGNNVIRGLILVIIGSIMHALTYVMCEGIMTVGEHRLSVRQNCAIQGIVASLVFLLWQIVYTLPRFDEKIWEPMQTAGTTASHAFVILILFGLSNTVHSITFFHTLRHYPGGATSAGVMKGLQAVLVFVFTHLAYCGRSGGEEMCFTYEKFLSLITVTSGVIGYGIVTQRRQEEANATAPVLGRHQAHQSGYEEVDDVIRIQELEPLA